MIVADHPTCGRRSLRKGEAAGASKVFRRAGGQHENDRIPGTSGAARRHTRGEMSMVDAADDEHDDRTQQDALLPESSV